MASRQGPYDVAPELAEGRKKWAMFAEVGTRSNW